MFGGFSKKKRTSGATKNSRLRPSDGRKHRLPGERARQGSSSSGRLRSGRRLQPPGRARLSKLKSHERDEDVRAPDGILFDDNFNKRFPTESTTNSKSKSSRLAKSRSSSNRSIMALSERSARSPSEMEHVISGRSSQVEASVKSSTRSVIKDRFIIGQGSYGTVQTTGHGYVLKVLNDRVYKQIIPQDFFKEIAFYQLAEPQTKYRMSYYIDAKHKEPTRIMMRTAGSGENLARLVFNPTTTATRNMYFHLMSQYAIYHSMGIINNDIKPCNILTNNRRNKAYIVDWGIMEFEGGDSINNTTLAYCSPEYLYSQIKTAGHKPIPASSKSDVWSLGVTLLDTVLTQRMKFDRKGDVFSQLQMICRRFYMEDYEVIMKKRNTKSNILNHQKRLRTAIKSIIEIDYNDRQSPIDALKPTEQYYMEQFYDMLSKMLSFRRDWRQALPELLEHPYFKKPNGNNKFKPLLNRIQKFKQIPRPPVNVMDVFMPNDLTATQKKVVKGAINKMVGIFINEQVPMVAITRALYYAYDVFPYAADINDCLEIFCCTIRLATLLHMERYHSDTHIRDIFALENWKRDFPNKLIFVLKWLYKSKHGLLYTMPEIKTLAHLKRNFGF
jgi:serine/threonine protein kinase